MIKCVFILMAVYLGLMSASAAATADFDKSILQVIVTFQKYDPSFPWRKTLPRFRKGYGVVVDDGLVMTTEDLVRNHTLVEIRRARSGTKAPATVVLSDYQVNLALLDISKNEAFEDMRPVKIASAMADDSPLTIVQFDQTGQIQTGVGHIAEISMSQLPKAESTALIGQVLTDLSIHGSAGVPVFAKDELSGLVIRYDRSAKTCHVLPYPILDKFIQASKVSPYPGIASAGLLWTPLIDPFKRAFLGLSKDQTGILVRRMLPASDQTLLPEDVVIEWDGFPLDSQGYYLDPDFGRILFSYLIKGRRGPGDIVPVTVIRNKQPAFLKLELKCLQDKNATIPYNVIGEPAEYLIEGGLVIRELTVDYLKALGSKWQVSAEPRLVYLYLKRYQITESPDDRIVILSRVFPDQINIGYQHLRDQVITAINGETVRNLSDVFRIVQRDGNIHRVSLKSMGIDVVLDPEHISDANARIARNYHIPLLRYQR